VVWRTATGGRSEPKGITLDHLAEADRVAGDGSIIFMDRPTMSACAAS
jgi:hypothetical protein